MDVKQIESFYWVGRLLSFSSAAQYLNTTQPNISARIQSLERELGATLFDRSNRQIRLTPAGLDLLRDAGKVIESIAALRQRAKGAGDVSGQLRLGVTNTVAHSWFPALIQRANQEYPALNIDFQVDTNEVLERLFKAHEIDMLVCTRPLRGEGIVNEFLFQSSFEWAAAETLPFSPGSVSPEELSQHRVITYPMGSAMYVMVANYFRDAGISLERMSGSNSLTAMTELVAIGAGVCAIPGIFLETKGQALGIRRLQVERRLPDIDFYMSYADDRLNQAVPLMARLVQEVCATWLAQVRGG